MMEAVLIKAVAGYVPPSRVETRSKGECFGYGEDFLESKLGTLRLARKDDDQQASDLCVKAWKAMENQGYGLEGIELLVVCTQTPDGHGIPHTSAVVHAKLGLPDECACFDISLGCSGYVYGIGIVKAFMAAHGLKRGLLFTADPYSEIIDPDDQATCLLFGDAATVTLFEAGASGWNLVDAVFATRGHGGEAIHNRSGRLSMNGREVFNFAMLAVPKQIHQLLGRQGLSLGDVHQVILHQGSRYIVDKLRERLRLSEDKVPVRLADLGNTVSSAVPLTWEQSLKTHVQASRVVLCGFGVGLSYATGLLERWE